MKNRVYTHTRYFDNDVGEKQCLHLPHILIMMQGEKGYKGVIGEVGKQGEPVRYELPCVFGTKTCHVTMFMHVDRIEQVTVKHAIKESFSTLLTQ